MRILVVSGIDPQVSSNNRLHYFLRYLNKRHQTVIVSVHDSWKRSQPGQEVFLGENGRDHERSKVIHFHSQWKSPMMQEINAWLRPAPILQPYHIQEFDLVYVYNALLSGLAFSRLAKKNKKKVVIDIADDLVAMVKTSPQISSGLRPFGAWLAKYALRRTITLADRVIVSAEQLRQNVPKKVRDKVVVIPNGVTFEHFRAAVSPIVNNGKLVLGYVGVLREWVDFEPVFSALRNTPIESVELRIIGGEGNLQQLQKRVARLGLENKVKFLGSVAYTDLPRVMKGIHVGLIPFKQNAITKGALPLKLFEYAAAEKIIVSSKLPEVQRVAKNEILFAETAAEYEQILSQLARNDYSSGKYQFAKNHDWEKLAQQVNVCLENA